MWAQRTIYYMRSTHPLEGALLGGVGVPKLKVLCVSGDAGCRYHYCSNCSRQERENTDI